MKALTKRRLYGCSVVCAMLLMSLAAWGCDPSIGGSEGNDPNRYAEEFTWTADAECIVCHKTEADLRTPTSGALHINDNALVCVNCHYNVAEMTNIHKGKTSSSKTPIRLLQTEVTDATCLSSACHVSQVQLAGLTKNSTKLKDKEGLVVNPHDLPDHASHQNAAIVCTSCHTMHMTKPTEERALLFCTGCHHEGLFECGTCH